MFGSVLDGVRSLCGRKMYQKIETISADKGYDTKSNRKTLGVYIESTAKTNEGMNKWNEDMDFIAWYVEV